MFMNKIICFGLVSLAGGMGMADTVEIRKGDTGALIEALKAYNGGDHTIVLDSGDYVMPDEPTWTNSYWGLASLSADGLHIKGSGENPGAVRLIGNGKNRILRGANNAVIENLTLTNGCAKDYMGGSDSARGGGCYGKVILTNCVVTGCSAEGPGGGCQNQTQIWNSWIVNNRGGLGGGFHNCKAYFSTIACNTSESDGGGIYTCAELVGCKVLSNKCVAVDKKGGGCWNVAFATNCIIAWNEASSAGGGVASGVAAGDTCCYWKCQIVSNVASAAGGAYQVTLRDSTVAYNKAVSGSGGGAYTCILSNCTVSANVCSNRSDTAYGGGLYDSTAVDCRIFGNASLTCVGTGGATRLGTAGGAANSTLEGCEIYDNYADFYGGGMRGSVARQCKIRNNHCSSDGANAHSSSLYGCNISGTGVHGGCAVGCVFHDIVDNARLNGNHYKKDVAWSGNLYEGIPVCTNCLFCNNRLPDYSQVLLRGARTPNRSMEIVNCTIVSNKFGKTFEYLTSSTFPAKIVNSVFVWNEAYNSTSFKDIHSWEDVSPEGIRFVNCAYGNASGLFASGESCDIALCADGPLYRFGTGGFPNDPKFLLGKDSEHPFSLGRHSPLCGIGCYAEWMASSTDIRGNGYPRATESQLVDIGCYQCWLPAPGMMLLVR